MPGAGLTVMSAGQARPDRLALKPYWGNPAVRNFREGDGNVGIIRSPVRAIALPDLSSTQGPRSPNSQRAPGSYPPHVLRVYSRTDRYSISSVCPTMRPVKTIEVILNAGSGDGNRDDARDRLGDAFKRTDLEARISVARTGSEAIALAQHAARSEADTIVAAGGDGTVNSVASAVLETGKTLGVLPFGTMNHFAKDLHIPLDLESAVHTIAARGEVTVDIGEVNGRIFLNNSSLGLYPSIVRERQKQQRLGSGKWPAYVWAALSVLRRYPFLNIRLSIHGTELTSRAPFVFIGNNRYDMDTFSIGGRACLDAGELSLYMTTRTDRLGLFRLALRALFGRLRQEKDFVALCTEELWIETRHNPLRVALDGEVTVMESPLHYRVRPKALRVLAGQPDQTR
jgi:diacylglycerol kinase family enzyme